MTIDLAMIKKDMLGASEDARQAAWLALYTSEVPEARKELERILSGPDPLLKIHAIRFLASVPEERAILYIRNSLGGLNPVVVNAAQKAFDKNRFEKKLDTLLPILHVKDAYAQHFAIERLSLATHPGVLEPLLRLMPHAEDLLLLKILAGLRHLADKQMVEPVSRYLKDAREEVRYWAVLVMGGLNQAGFKEARPLLLAALKDDVARIRRAVLWSMRPNVRKQDLPSLLHLSEHDPDPLVRQESLQALSPFPTPEVILHILKVLVTDKNRIVILKGEAVLIGMPPQDLVAGLRKAVRSADDKFRSKAIVLAAEFMQDDTHYCRFLANGLEAAADDKERLPFIEALGVFGDPRSIPLLEVYLERAPIAAYAAMSALLKIGGRQQGLNVLNYLRHPKLSLVLKQMVLKHLLRRESSYEMSQGLLQTLVAFLESDNINIRYLSSQILIRTNRDSIFAPLLDTVLRESDPTSLKLLRHSIIKLLSSNPMLCVQMLEQHRNNATAVHFLLSMIEEARTPGRVLLILLPLLLGEPFNLFESEYKDAVVGLIFNALLQNKVGLDDVMETIRHLPGREEILLALVERYRSGPAPSVKLAAAILENWLADKNFRQREAVIGLASLCSGVDIIRLLVSLLCRAEFSEHTAQIAGALRQMWKAAA